jgi:formylglycine-generating enzyme required for sulfatase activity
MKKILFFSIIIITAAQALAAVPPFQSCNLSHSSFEVDHLGAGGGGSQFDPDGSWDCQNGAFENGVVAWTSSGTLPSRRVYGSSDIFAVDFSVPQSGQYQIILKGRLTGKVWSFGKDYLIGYEWGGYQIMMMSYLSNSSGYNISLSDRQLFFEGMPLEPDCEGCAYTIAFDDEGSFWQGVGEMTWGTVSSLLTGGAGDLADLIDLVKTIDDVIPEEWNNSEFQLSGYANLIATQNYKCKVDISSYVHSNSIALIGGHVGIIDLDFVIDEITIKPKTIEININAFAGTHGSISPSGTLTVEQGSSKTFYATPDSGYVVDKWYINGQAYPGSEGWGYLTLSNIQQNTSVLVTFKSAPPAGSITVTAPTAGQYARGKTMHIGWNAVNVSGNVKIELYQGSTFHSVIEDSIAANYGMESWHIPSDLELRNDYRIKISALSSTEVSYSSYFEVIAVVDNGTPIPIYNVQELQKISSGQVVNGRVFSRDGYYVLANDIDASGFNFVPIGTESTYFRGTLDGQGFTITNLEIDIESQDYVGLFCYTGDNTVIKNLTFSGGYIRGKSYVGVIVGEFSGMLINCHSSAEVRGTKLQPSYNIGGLVGGNYKGEIRNCSTFGTAAIRGYGDTAGGIAGENESFGKIYWCWTTATDVTADDSGTSSTVYNAGGIAGENYGEIVECYSINSNEIRSHDYHAGGIAGYNNTGNIRNCYSNSRTNGQYIGGIVGRDNGISVNCYATGSVGNSKGGGLFGDYSGVASNCFWDTQTTGKVTCTYYGTCPVTCYGKTTAEMKQIDTFNSDGWDFDNIWYIDEGVDYPRLRGAKPCLSVPTNVTASDAQANRITIEFATVADAGVFKVYRSDSADGLFNPITDWLPITNHYEDTSVIPNVAYFYKVKVAYTINGAGESEFSNYDEGICTFKLSSPANISATDDIMDYVFVQWEPVTGAGYYRVYRSESELGMKTAMSGWIDSLSFLDTSGVSNISYYYWVVASADSSGTGQSDYAGPAIGKRPAPPNPDLSGDGFVNFIDFAILASHWLETCSEPNYCENADYYHDGQVDLSDLSYLCENWLTGSVPPEIVWVSINEPNFTGEMSKYETTNAQYCQFLNAAIASGDITVDGNNVLGANGSNSGADFVGQVYYYLAGTGDTYNGATNGGAARINYIGGVFTVDSGFENHPVTYVSWYGATAFCNYYGYRLPTEWEWQAVADYDGNYTYGCGTTINNSMANCRDSSHPNGTTVVGAFGTYGYGMCDMAGNVLEWTSSCYYSDCAYGWRVIRGGGWYDLGGDCIVSSRDGSPFYSLSGRGFRVCR